MSQEGHKATVVGTEGVGVTGVIFCLMYSMARSRAVSATSGQSSGLSSSEPLLGKRGLGLPLISFQEGPTLCQMAAVMGRKGVHLGLVAFMRGKSPVS